MKHRLKQFAGYSVAAAERVTAMRIPLHAAYACYFLILSLFPFLLLLLTFIRFTGHNIQDLVSLLNGVLPSNLHRIAETVILNTYAQSTSTMAGLSALVAVWSSSTGLYGVLMGLNAVYNVTEDRGYFYTRGISVLYSVGFLAVVILTLTVSVFGNAMVELLLGSTNPLIMFFVDLIDLHAVLLTSVQAILFTLMYMVLPNKHNRFWESLPGGILAAFGWQIFSYFYSIYIRLFPRYISIFGSIYTVALSMLWLYICISIVFYGGAFNNLLRKFSKNRFRNNGRAEDKKCISS